MTILPVSPIPEASRADLEDCTVTSVSPLRIKRDADAVELAFTPGTLVNTAFLTIGDRVRVDISRKPMLIIGRADGLAGVDTIVARDAAIASALAGRGDQLIIPSGVAGGATLSGGIVSFTNLASFSVETAFPSAYDHFEFFLFLSAASGGTDIWMRMRTAAPADLTTGIYARGRVEQSSATVSGVWATADTGFNIGRSQGANGAAMRGVVMGPNLAAYTRIFSESIDDAFTMDVRGTVKNTTAYPSLTIYTGGATMTGTFCLYGKRKS